MDEKEQHKHLKKKKKNFAAKHEWIVKKEKNE